MQTAKIYLSILGDMLKGFRQLLTVHKLTLQEVIPEGENIKTFIFRSNKKLTYQPGQYGIWVLKRWVRGKPNRLFTVASPPEDGLVQLSTRISNSDFKQKLNQLKVGDRMIMFGPIGVFTLPKPPPKSIVLIAGGIGITPMRALAKHIHQQQLPVQTTLVHSANGFYLYQDEMARYTDQAFFVTRETFARTLDQAVQASDAQTIYYVSGPPAFVQEAEQQLKQRGVRDIKKDGFLGY